MGGGGGVSEGCAGAGETGRVRQGASTGDLHCICERTPHSQVRHTCTTPRPPPGRGVHGRQDAARRPRGARRAVGAPRRPGGAHAEAGGREWGPRLADRPRRRRVERGAAAAVYVRRVPWQWEANGGRSALNLASNRPTRPTGSPIRPTISIPTPPARPLLGGRLRPLGPPADRRPGRGGAHRRQVRRRDGGWLGSVWFGFPLWGAGAVRGEGRQRRWAGLGWGV